MNGFRKNQEDLAIKFEGPEKKLEIILYRPLKNLRNPSSGSWKRVVAASGAEIISKISNKIGRASCRERVCHRV